MATAIDDKIIEAAQTTNTPMQELTLKFETIYNEDMAALGVHCPDIQPRATDHIAEMIDLTKTLVKLGHAYEKEGHVIFHVPSFEKYGCLSGRNRDEQIIGSRVEVAPFKKDPTDFILWKPSPDPLPGWDSPWGFGRPGWHLECSAMSEKTLGLPFDIHSGGMDLIFPHHENEIAQTCSAHKKINNPKYFAKYWFHNGFENVEGEKMSKSLGNFTNLAEAIDTAGPRALRLLALQTHYRRAMEMGRDALSAAAAAIDRLDAFHRRMRAADIDLVNGGTDPQSLGAFREAMDDDFGTPVALDQAFSLVREANAGLDDGELAVAGAKARTAAMLFTALGIEIGIDDGATDSGPEAEEIEGLIEQRQTARSEGDFETADRIRDQLAEAGIAVEDTADGVTWHRT